MMTFRVYIDLHEARLKLIQELVIVFVGFQAVSKPNLCITWGKDLFDILYPTQ